MACPLAQNGEELCRWATYLDADLTYLLEDEHEGTEDGGGGEALRITVRQDPSTDELGHCVWDIGLWACSYVRRDADMRARLASHARVIELGAGCGLLSIVSACLGARVVATDGPAVMPLLAENVAQYESVARTRGGALRCELFWWTAGPPMPYDVVLATDCLYAEHMVEPLLAALLRTMQNHTIALVAHETRIPAAQQAFRRAAEPHFTAKTIDMAAYDDRFDPTAYEALLLRRRV